jgi:RHS repeat-associated protein
VLAEQEQDTNGTVTTTTWDHEPGTWTPVSQSRRTAAADAPQHVIDQRFHAIVTDPVGTPTELVTADGRVDWRHRTNLWGEERQGGAPSTARCGFPGQYQDRETGLYYNYHRHYDPSTGRYTGPDPLGLIAKDRYLHMDRDGWSNYVLRDANGTAYYSGMFGPNTTLADVEARHAANHNRYDPANGDTIETVPGTRTYGVSRLMEQRLAEQYGTVIGRDGTTTGGTGRTRWTRTRWPSTRSTRTGRRTDWVARDGSSTRRGGRREGRRGFRGGRR